MGLDVNLEYGNLENRNKKRDHMIPYNHVRPQLLPQTHTPKKIRDASRLIRDASRLIRDTRFRDSSKPYSRLMTFTILIIVKRALFIMSYKLVIKVLGKTQT